MRRIFADHCVYLSTVEILRKSGFDVLRAGDVNLKRAPDQEIFNFAIQQKRILFTFDREFGNPFKFDIGKSFGVVIILVKNRGRKEIAFDSLNFFKKFQKEKFKGCLFIVRENFVRAIKRF